MINYKTCLAAVRLKIKNLTSEIGVRILCFVLCLLSLTYSSCKKKEKSSTTPILEFVSISPSSAVEYQNSITITFSYDDLDGDLGEDNPNVYNLFVTDSRNSVTYQYRISQLSPSGSNIHIKGNLNTVIKGTAITDGSSAQAVTYSLYLKDRAGNTSNTITTSAITITK